MKSSWRMAAAGTFAVLIGFAACSEPQTVERVVADFGFPWAEGPAPRTVFRARTDGERLHFVFEADDPDVVVEEIWRGESTVDGEDRVELFFAKDDRLDDYWCLEIDPMGRVHDYHARRYRRFDDAWNVPGLEVDARRSPTGYVVRASLPLKTIGDLLERPIARGSALRIGLFRADFHGTDPVGRGEADDNWISWVRPGGSSPDFHVPEAFATFVVP